MSKLTVTQQLRLQTKLTPAQIQVIKLLELPSCDLQQRINEELQENPALEFEVQGHCDASGSDKVNDPLSQKRAESIVAALVEQGIAKARLSAVGKGSHQPIATNSTDEGRSKNRREEFVKK